LKNEFALEKIALDIFLKQKSLKQKDESCEGNIFISPNTARSKPSFGKSGNQPFILKGKLWKKGSGFNLHGLARRVYDFNYYL